MNLWWYLARAGGIVAWALLAGSVAWGLALSSRTFRSLPKPAWLLDIHRFLGGLAVVFTGIHVAALVGDSYVHFGPAEILVPLASRWHPVAVAWGVIAMYMLIAIEATSLLMRRLPNRVWRAVHRSSFVLFLLSSAHALSAGSDTVAPVVGWTTVTFVGWLTFMLLMRVLTRGGKSPGRSRRQVPVPVVHEDSLQAGR